jgi:hypothetical protein
MAVRSCQNRPMLARYYSGVRPSEKAIYVPGTTIVPSCQLSHGPWLANAREGKGGRETGSGVKEGKRGRESNPDSTPDLFPFARDPRRARGQAVRLGEYLFHKRIEHMNLRELSLCSLSALCSPLCSPIDACSAWLVHRRRKQAESTDIFLPARPFWACVRALLYRGRVLVGQRFLRLERAP